MVVPGHLTLKCVLPRRDQLNGYVASCNNNKSNYIAQFDTKGTLTALYSHNVHVNAIKAHMDKHETIIFIHIYMSTHIYIHRHMNKYIYI